MDINTLRVILLVLCFIAFLGIIWWAYGGRRKSRFEEAAQLPFNEEKLISGTPDKDTTTIRSTIDSGPDTNRPLNKQER